MSPILIAGLLLTVLLLVVSLAIALVSFLPRIDPSKLTSRKAGQPQAGDNLYFFGDLQKYQADELAEAVARRYGAIHDYDASHHPGLIDLAGQIISNSRITVLKNEQFRVATLLTLVALGAGVLSTVLTLLFGR